MSIGKRINSALTVIIMLLVAADIIAGESYASSSVLSSGKWFKAAITSDGIYRIDYSKLKQMGLANPSNPKIYGNNQGQLSYYNTSNSPDDLIEIPVYLNRGTDGIFNEGDYLLFYAMGTHRWKYNIATDDYEYIRHNYSDTSFYFITSSSGPVKTIQDVAAPSGSPVYYTSSTEVLYNHEVESENLIKSGREWYQPISVFEGIQINPGFTNLVPSEKVEYSLRVLARSSIPSLFRLQEGESVLAGVLVPEVILLSSTGTYARDGIVSGSVTPSSTSPAYVVKFFNNGESAAKAWIDYVRLRARAVLSFNGKSREFFDSRSVSPGGITEFTIKSNITDMVMWDITDPMNPRNVPFTRNGDNCRFVANTDSLRRFIAFSYAGSGSPRIRNSELPNQDLHSSEDADMIIVTHPLFLKYAAKLASIHEANSGLKSLIVTPEQIYNEYSGGIPDIAAIRNFIRMKYMRQLGSDRLKYLLLFGDGSYENKTQPPHNPNYIPTWQSQNSTVVVSSFTSDDFYGLLEDGEGEAEGTEDIGIGRFPVSDTASAGVLVEKTRRYLDSSSTGNWRNIITIAADDEDGNAHMSDAEGLYSLLNNSYPQFNVDKIYLDAFRQVTSVNGQSYPDVTKAIDDRINSGCLIFNYLGHGNEIGLAHERVVKTENINSWKNLAKLPMFITATCEFSRFDDIEINPITRDMVGKNSAGEMVLLNHDGGGIALMTTTRVVYSAPNYTLNRNIYNYAFTPDENGEALRLGDVIRLAKLNSGNGMNKRNFLLLGDPAIRLAYPWHGNVVTDSVNGISVTMPSDSLKALSLITVSGHVEDNSGNTLSGFNGTVWPLVFDKAAKIRTLSNDGGPTMEFELRNSIIFSGKSGVKNGMFSFSFIVPKDISYSFGPGKISYYASEGDTDMAGDFRNIIVGGFSNTVMTDTTGPEIKLFLNDSLFRQGGITGSDPVLLAIIKDEGGINTTGSGIGHDLTAWLNGDKNQTYVLNSFFETEINDFSKGRVNYPVGYLGGGDHSITLKAWDNFNNSSEATLNFVVRTEEGFILNNLINYPNPFTDQTNITAEHNRPDEDMEVRIDIYNMNGQKIKVLETEFVTTGYRLPPISWDGNDDGGNRVGRGIYPYTVVIRTSSGEVSRVSGRMIIL